MRALLVTLLAAGCVAPSSSEPGAHDVCVYGATSAGVIAAVQADRLGLSVLLVETDDHVGGLSSAGLGATDIGDSAAIGGMSREFYQRIRAYYEDPAAWTREAPHRGAGFRDDADAMFRFEPSVAEQVFEALLAETAVTRVRGLLDREDGVRMDGTRIRSIELCSGEVLRARVFLDATYEGDLMAAAGVTYTTGRESNWTFGETYNGVQFGNATKHQFGAPLDPSRSEGTTRELLPGIGEQLTAAPTDGEADHRIQAYCFRLCLTDDPGNRLAFERPEDYDPRDYELLLRWFEAGGAFLPWHSIGMPNRKTDTNNNGPFSLDHIGANHDYPDASYARRAEIVADHERYQRGLLWTLANHPRVPEAIRAEASRFGLAADEFVETGGWPHELYVREARRMISDYVMTDRDCLGQRSASDPVGMGAYNMDSHNVRRVVTGDGSGPRNEGDVQIRLPGPYRISYQALVPAAGECSNLVVPVCVSASHIAFGSIRMEPVFMVLAQSGAVAAAHAIEDDVDLQDVDYPRLRAHLLELGQALDPE